MPQIPNSENTPSEKISASIAASANAIAASADKFYKENGIEEFGTAVFQGEVMSSAAEKSRLSQSEADGDVRRRIELLNFLIKDALVYLASIVIVLGLAAISGFMLLEEDASTQEKDWAKATLTAIGGSVAGYVFGKGSSKA
jgi:hypothetical protein